MALKGNKNIVSILFWGIKYDESDGLSRFKKKFSDSKKVFYITKLICNSDLYNETRNSFQIDNSQLFLIGDALEK